MLKHTKHTAERVSYETPICLSLKLLEDGILCSSMVNSGSLDDFTVEDFPW